MAKAKPPHKGKMTEALDAARDAKMRVPEGTRKDNAMDVAAGLPSDATADPVPANNPRPRYIGKSRFK